MDYAQVIYSISYEYFLNSLHSSADYAKKLAAFVVAQTKHETADYTSALFKDDKNVCGYSYVGQSGAMPSTVHFNGVIPYAHYSSVNAGALELVKWIGKRWTQFNSLDNLSEYCLALRNNGFYTDSYSNYYANTLHYYLTPDKFSPVYPSLLSGDVAEIAIPLVLGGVLLYILS